MLGFHDHGRGCWFGIAIIVRKIVVHVARREAGLRGAVTARAVGIFESGRDHRDLHRIFHLLIEHGSEDDIGVFVSRGLDDAASFLDLGQFERGRAGDVDEDAARPVDGSSFEQRRSNGFLGGFGSATRAVGGRGAHHRVAHALHDGLHVGEVAGDDVGDALHALTQNVVSDAEGLEEAGVLGDGQQFLIGDDDSGVYRVHQLGDATLGLHHSPLAFKGEGLGDDRHREGSHLAGQRGDDGGGSSAGTAAKSRGNEDHVGAFEGLDDLVGILERGFAADFGVGARAQSIGELDAELNFHGRARHAQRLQIGVGCDEFDAFHAGVDHAVDRIAAATTHSDDLDLGVIAGLFVKADANVVFFFFHVRRHI